MQTKLIASLFSARLREIDRYAERAEEIQRAQLRSLLKTARRTEYGRKYDFATVDGYRTFSERLPLMTYEELKPYVMRMQQGEQRLVWPSDIRWFAKSSGTTNDKSKFIPVSREAMRDCHYRGGKDCVALYLRMNPASRFFSGKGLILGGSRNVSALSDHAFCGDLSAILIENISPLVNLIRVPEKRIALMDEWEEKLKAIVARTRSQHITNLSGVPSWFLVLIKQLLQATGKENLTEVWPDLEVFFHGGISFEPYREQYRRLIPSEKMHYVETYNASEGFFSVQNDLSDRGMLLMIDLGIFFEFIPVEEMGSEHPTVLPLWETEPGRVYALAISTNSGLWRYLPGDTVRVTSTRPYKIVVAGRTKHYINAFGEELMVDNAEKGIAAASRETGAVVLDYTAAPVFMQDRERGCHQWLVEFDQPPASPDAFAASLDRALQRLNSDYEAKRYRDLVLKPLQVIPARRGLFHDWLDRNGKLGGQHKVPRLSNDRKILEELLRLNG